MKLILLACLVAGALAAGPNPDQVVPIVSQESNINPDGTFHTSYESGDGSKAVQDGQLIRSQDPKEPDALAHSGTFSYTAPDGTKVETTYTADAEGFHPQGSHLPVAPPVPEQIQRALKYIAEHPPPPEPQAQRQA
ncbi:endocuticle structural glycoprotein SgAbd-4 [Anabrus simplex]|uniref:endocuticle structural glycoprotein SgAbd-4 n=1 Tax=Anabrus simplex TaxID=316456 RepID=UPI0035A2F1BA